MLAAFPEAGIGGAEFHAPRLCRRQGGLGPVADLAGFVVGHARHNVDGPAVDLVVVQANKVNLAFQQQPGDGDVPRQPAEVGNH